MPSLIDRVTSFGRSPKGQGLIRQTMSRFTGGKDTRKGAAARVRPAADAPLASAEIRGPKSLGASALPGPGRIPRWPIRSRT